MEKGEMRVEANISVSDDPNKLGTKVEVKNLNSFKVVEKAINLEIERMTKLLEEGRGEEIIQETRGFDENKQKTFSQRKKETSDDYRYFPEPDLPKMNLHEVFDLKKMEEDLPELPKEKRQRFAKDYEIKETDIELYVFDKKLADFFELVVSSFERRPESTLFQTISNYILSDIVSLIKEGEEFPNAKNFATLTQMISEEKISSRVAKDVLALMVKDKELDPEKYVNENKLLQKDDSNELKAIIERILSKNVSAVEDFKSGKENALQFLVGQIMKETKGSTNPKKLQELLREFIK
jgi:aspartyl-tRNA(Asn)/glutamyl-tRNA(Gln) amidotransferase subunit B